MALPFFNCHLIVITVTIQRSRTTRVYMTLMAAMPTHSLVSHGHRPSSSQALKIHQSSAEDSETNL